MKTEILVCFLACISYNIVVGSQKFCPLPSGYGRWESKAEKSSTADSYKICADSAGTSNWISYDSTSKTCKLYGKVDITDGMISGITGAVKHYSTSACQINGCGVSSEYQQCLKFFDGRSRCNNPYSGFTCQKGPFGHPYLSNSDISLRKAGGPISAIAIHYRTYPVKYGMVMKITYGRGSTSKESNHGSMSGDSQLGYMSGACDIRLVEGDCINKIEVRAGKNSAINDDSVFQLSFTTIKRWNHGPCGIALGTVYEVKAPEGSCLSWVDTRAGTWLNGIAFTFEPYSEFFKV